MCTKSSDFSVFSDKSVYLEAVHYKIIIIMIILSLLHIDKAQ